MNLEVTKKIVVLGQFGVGKTSLIRRFVDSVFSENYLVTLGVQVKKKVVEINDVQVNLIIWDVEGKDSIADTRKSYLIGAHAILYIFDVSRKQTYENLEEELKLLHNLCPKSAIRILGNKVDLITNSQIIELKEFLNSSSLIRFTSAKTGEYVDETFVELTIDLI